jgi:hypothetical protein
MQGHALYLLVRVLPGHTKNAGILVLIICIKDAGWPTKLEGDKFGRNNRHILP